MSRPSLSAFHWAPHLLGLAVLVSFSFFSFLRPVYAGEASYFSENALVNPFGPLEETVERFSLSNGMRVLFVRRTTAPVFTGQIWVGVGGVDEHPGITGASHLLEHMAFKGTLRVGTRDFEQEKPLLERLEALFEKLDKSPSEQLHAEIARVRAQLRELWIDNEFSKIYNEHGAVGLNAGTSKDYTVYTVDLPSVAFDLWCIMESERLLAPVFRQFYLEREVVLEERRMRVSDNPGGTLYEQLLASAYLSHPYRLPVIGWRSDLERLQPETVRRLHRSHYRPDNIVVSIVGDLDSQELREKLERYFGRMKRLTSSDGYDVTEEVPQRGKREFAVNFQAEPQLLMAFHKPAHPHPDDAYFAVLHALLSEGRSSLLHRVLVQQEKLAASVFTTEAPGEKHPSVFIVGAIPHHGISTDRLRDRIQHILDNLDEKAFPPARIRSAIRRVKIGLLETISSDSGLASVLGRMELLWGDWREILNILERIETTSAADLVRLSQVYLDEHNRTAGHLVRASEEILPQAGGTQ